MKSIKPVRVQKTRQHPYINPNGLDIVYVGRPSKFGNPFKTAKEYEEAINDNNIFAQFTLHEIRTELKGKNLACWCPLDKNKQCHADVLLKIANT